MADTGCSFDAELLVHAERAGVRLREVPVDWVEDRDSRVDIEATARADLAGIVRMLRRDRHHGAPSTRRAGQDRPLSAITVG